MGNKIKFTKSAGGIIVNKDGKIAVVLQLRNSTWSFPKGHIDKEEEALNTAKREILEETGINKIKLTKKLGEYTRCNMKEGGLEDTRELKTIIMFLFRTTQDIKDYNSKEIGEVRWLKKDEVVKLLSHPKDKEFFRNYIKEI
ncbi:MAG: hypothetical protein HW405_94 [Candidatus Berkelbacteria bacterium]|nr:hypothetical protein [Candidatus Berkelbacteria bacterium]